MDTKISFLTTCTSRLLSTKGGLVGNLLQISVFVYLIYVASLCHFTRFGEAFISAFRSRSRLRRYDLAYSIQASRTSSSIQQRRRV